MPKLYVFRGRRKEASYDLDRKRFVVGRGDDVDIRLDNPLVSRRHAVISFEGGRWRVEELATANGLWVNSVRVTTSDLAIGDTIEIGHHTLVFESPGAYLAAIDTIPGGFTAPTEDESTTVLPPSEVAGIQKRVRERLKTHLVFLADGRRREFPLEGASYVVGFSDDCDVRLPGSPLLGKQAARVARIDGDWTLQALSALTPVRIDGVKIGSHPLRDGDQFVIKGVAVTFHDTVVG